MISQTLAAVGLAPTGVKIQDYFTPAARFNTLGGTATTIGKIVALAGGLMVFMGFVYGAYLVITSQGEAKKMQEAQQIFIWGIVGLIVILGSFWIVQIIGTLLGPQGGLF